jgi:hypothetical protein
VRIYKTLPDLQKTKQIALWHKGLRSGWAPNEIEWNAPGLLKNDEQLDQLARVLSPVAMGEQAALYSITTVIQVLGQTADVEGQFFLTTMMVDEAKHAEAFARYYARMQREPLSIRRFPSGYLFQAEIMSRDPIEWLTGSLVSEVLAKVTLEELRSRDLDPLLSDLCSRILEDEARHLAFNHVFLSDRFREAYAQEPHDAEESAQKLRVRLEKVLDMIPPMLDALEPDTKALGLRSKQVHERVVSESRERLGRSIAPPAERDGSADIGGGA